MINDKGILKLSWYRALEQYQKTTDYCSIRGGDHRSFYIHPQNYRKTEPYAWLTILDRVEQLQIPKKQYGCYDCEGSFYDWCIPKRREKMAVVICYRNITLPQFFSKRFHDRKCILTAIAAVIIVFFFIPYTAAGFAGCGKLFNALFGIDYMTAMLISALVIVGYTATGGFMAVTYQCTV